jgi:hypothetical protein
MTRSIDVTGLPEPVIEEIERLVAGLRRVDNGTAADEKLSAEEWTKRWRAWCDSHPRREIIIDDSRESIYAERGE